MMTLSELREKLRAHIARSGESETAFARRTGLQQASVSRFLAGKTGLSYEYASIALRDMAYKLLPGALEGAARSGFSAGRHAGQIPGGSLAGAEDPGDPAFADPLLAAEKRAEALDDELQMTQILLEREKKQSRIMAREVDALQAKLRRANQTIIDMQEQHIALQGGRSLISSPDNVQPPSLAEDAEEDDDEAEFMRQHQRTVFTD